VTSTHPRTPREMPPTLGRVLVVDDEPQLNAMLCEALAGMEYDVKGALDGARALEVISVFHPNVVLLDLHMRGMSGFEVLDHLRRDSPEVRVIVVSGDADQVVARRTLRNGAVNYVTKPFNLEVLRQAVADALAQPRPVV